MDVINQDKAIQEEESYYWQAQKASLDRLMKNKDFKTVILEGYFNDKAVKGVNLLAADRVRRSGLRPEVMESLVAISNLQDHFMVITNLGAPAETEDEE